jgi:hypothetical protein
MIYVDDPPTKVIAIQCYNQLIVLQVRLLK